MLHFVLADEVLVEVLHIFRLRLSVKVLFVHCFVVAQYFLVPLVNKHAYPALVTIFVNYVLLFVEDGLTNLVLSSTLLLHRVYDYRDFVSQPN